MLTLLLALSLPLADDPHAAAVAKYKVLLTQAEKSLLDAGLRGAKRELADARRGMIDPLAARGSTIRMVDRGDGVFVQAKEPLRFGSADDKRTAIENAEKRLAVAESDFDLWKAGKYRPSVTVPTLDTVKLAIGQVGMLPAVRLVSPGEPVLIRGGAPRPMILEGYAPDRLPTGEQFTLAVPFWVSGKRTIGTQSLFVVEPLSLDVQK